MLVKRPTRLLDLAILAFTSRWRAEGPVVARLWAEFFSIGDEQRCAVYMHHTVLRLVDWTIRHETPTVAQHTVAAAELALASLDAGRFR